MTGAEAFYERDGDLFISSELTRGPWDPHSQHAGPPSALIGDAIERLPVLGEEPMRIGRITYDIVRPVPIASLRVETEVLRPGKRVELVAARLTDADGEVLVRANAWRLRAGAPLELPGDLAQPAPAPPSPEAGAHADYFPTGQEVGYHTGMEYRFIEGGFIESGPARAWMRMRQPLIAGEEPTPLQRVLTAADTGNGISAAIDWKRFLFINVDLSVHLHRYPEGEWVFLDAITVPEPDGIGFADTRLSDPRGQIGRADQTLLIAERS